MSNHPAACDCIDCDWGSDTWFDTRFQCRRCHRFISQDAIREEHHRDNGVYYGVSTRTEYDCGRCGTVKDEPALVVFPIPECGERKQG